MNLKASKMFPFCGNRSTKIKENKICLRMGFLFQMHFASGSWTGCGEVKCFQQRKTSTNAFSSSLKQRSFHRCSQMGQTERSTSYQRRTERLTRRNVWMIIAGKTSTIDHTQQQRLLLYIFSEKRTKRRKSLVSRTANRPCVRRRTVFMWTQCVRSVIDVTSTKV